jgi:Major capsid protein N-terminus/Large eukaryotic DNA virus major capsid protein
MCDDGTGTGTGAMLALDAIGRQDEFLTGNAASYFQFVNLQHTQFTKYSSVVSMASNGSRGWPFGQEIIFTLDPKTMGDLLLNMYLKIELPDLSSIDGFYGNTGYTGYAMINKIELRVDDVLMETIQADWNVINDELYRTDEEKVTMTKIINQSKIYYGGELYIPLNFFFARTHTTTFTSSPTSRLNYFKPCLLTCALYKQKHIQVKIYFANQENFSISPTFGLDSIYLVTEEVILSKQEREYIKNNTQVNTVAIVTNEAVTKVRRNQSPFYANLTPTRPVKIMHWFMRNEYFEVGNFLGAIDDRFNYSSTSSFYTPVGLLNYETVRPIISQTGLYLNGVQMMGSSTKPMSIRNIQDGSLYFKFLQSFTNDLYSPFKNIYSYSFCLHPKDSQPSGAINFSRMNANLTRLTGSLFDYDFIEYPYINGEKITLGFNLYVYYVGYAQVTYSGGRISVE